MNELPPRIQGAPEWTPPEIPDDIEWTGAASPYCLAPETAPKAPEPAPKAPPGAGADAEARAALDALSAAAKRVQELDLDESSILNFVADALGCKPVV